MDYQFHRKAILYFFVSLAYLVFPSYGVADNIDEELIRQAPNIMKKLVEGGYENVGVLNFRVQVDDERPTFRAGLMNQNMATRVENSLIMAINPESKPLGITRDASLTANQKIEDANYRTPDARRKLFDLKYPLAWTTQDVSVTAFLAGKVAISPDNRTTTVTIELFDQANPDKVQTLHTFEVKTDRFILSDIGKGYSTSKGKQNFSRGVSDDDIIVSIDDEKKSSAQAPTSGNFPVEFKVFYNDKPVTFSSDPKHPGTNNWTIPEPTQGQKVTFGVKNLTNELIGVVLTANGTSTLHEKTGQPDQMPKWVLEPGKTYMIKGFHQEDGKTYIPISVLPEKLSQQKFNDFGPMAGKLHLYVFRKAAGQLASVPTFSRSMRQVSKDLLPNGPVNSVSELQSLIVKSGNVRSTRGLMFFGNEKKTEDLREMTLKDVSLTDTMIVQYFESKSIDSKLPAVDKK